MEFRVGVLTPYLTGEVISRHRDDEKELRLQVGAFGAQDMRGNIVGFKEQEKGIYTRGSLTLDLRNQDETPQERMIEESDLVIKGCTRAGEREVALMKSQGSGLVVGRCSIFYGRESGYTGTSAAKAGYAFDLPKVKEVVLSFITNEGIAKGILERDLEGVVERTRELNEQLIGEGKPAVLVTEYLGKAMRVPHEDSRERTRNMINGEEWRERRDWW